MVKYRRFIKPILLLLILTLVIPMPLLRVKNVSHAAGTTGNLTISYNVEGVSFGNIYYSNIQTGVYRVEVCRLTSAGWRWGVNYGTHVNPGSTNFAMVFIYSFGQPCYYSWEFNTSRLIKIG